MDYSCAVCGKVDVWSEGWKWYGSLLDIDNGNQVIHTCSQTCRDNSRCERLITELPQGDQRVRGY